jgi:uncharacterized protein
MYESLDRSALVKNATMAADTLSRTLDRVAEHAATHHLGRLRVVFHGGEPLLAGVHRLAAAASHVRRKVGPDTIVDFVVQSNGLQLTRSRLEVLAAAGIRVGVSVDGDRQAMDRHRRTRTGGSAFDQIRTAIRLLGEYPDSYAGLLCVVDLDNDPVRTYEALLEHRPPRVDFLLPLGNWSNPPPGRPPTDDAPYGDWLVAVYDRWYDAPAAETRVRLFESILGLIAGRGSRSESIGLSPTAVVVVDVDGAVEQVDTLRTTFAGAVDTGLNIFDHTFDDALAHPDIMAQQAGIEALSSICLSCPLHRICGGGYYPHRYRDGAGFANPSVYCADLTRLIRHVLGRVGDDLARVRGKRDSGASPVRT